VCESIEEMRKLGLVVEDALCVIDREQGGEANLAKVGCALRSLFRQHELENLAAETLAADGRRGVVGLRVPAGASFKGGEVSLRIAMKAGAGSSAGRHEALRRQSLGSIGYMAGAGFMAAALVARVLGFRFESHPRTVGLVAAAIAGGLILGDVVLDVLGAVHQDAVRGGPARRRTSGGS
jgi:hypothetical protein